MTELRLYRCDECGVLLALEPPDDESESALFHTHPDGNGYRVTAVTIGSAGLHWFHEIRTDR